MRKFKKGDRVTYMPHHKEEKGIIKEIQNDDYAFVVYNCAGNWADYIDYTGARTRISDLKMGWN